MANILFCRVAARPAIASASAATTTAVAATTTFESGQVLLGHLLSLYEKIYIRSKINGLANPFPVLFFCLPVRSLKA